ncbi:N-6 DNA methylase [Chthoniobacter flavus]|nr:N-6 DNA methylase [Chthoniobacter flavus]
MDVTTSPAEDAAACRVTGAPITLLCQQNELLWWKQGPSDQREYLRVPATHLEGFFREHRKDFEPGTIYRAKTIGRFEATYQREFVDLGLMPMVEKEAGEVIERLLLEQVAALRGLLGWPKDLSAEQGQWLVRAVFWLLGAKMLHDKSVDGFIRLDFGDVDQVFERVARHYGQSAESIITSQKKRQALQYAANNIAQRADLRLATTEALAYVYENTLISREVRKELGTHSTPAYLVDYIVGRLSPWIEEIPSDQRYVYEPACGHAGFLVAAVRLLTSLLPTEQATPPHRRAYLRERIQGSDVDSFALEIARLSLTLTDIPNPNGWKLKQDDAFASDLLESAASGSRILLANPPFEKIEPARRDAYTRQFRAPQFVSQAAEILHRAISALPSGGVFGVVVPQNLLHSSDATAFRRMLTDKAEFEEICLFPDKMFNFADVESGILIGRKVGDASGGKKLVRYRRVREGEATAFRSSYAVTGEITVPMSRFAESESCDFRVPDLEEVWASCAQLPKLEDFVEIGQGFSFIGEDQPGFPKGQKRTSPTPKEGFVKGFENLGDDVMSHQLPPTTYLNMAEEIILRPRAGNTTGVPQVLLNEAPVQRGPWCVKAMIDLIGRPATTRFTLMRPNGGGYHLKNLWALINSTFAAAFAHTHSTKRDILTGTWRGMPVPSVLFVDRSEGDRALSAAVDAYLSAVHDFENNLVLASDEDRAAQREALKILHWRMDAEVLKLYALPVELERKLLDYFAGCKRVGVPFDQDRYFPEGFNVPLSLADYLAIIADWETINARRLALIDRKRGGKLTGEETTELANLKRLARAKSALVMPLPMRELEEQENDLRRRGLWRGE